jgi:hypothetical protein
MGLLTLFALVLGALGITSPVGLVLGSAALVRTRRRGGDLFPPLLAVGLGIGGTALLAVLFLLWREHDIPARERAVIDQLQKIHKAQEDFRRKGYVDQDGDGAGEYGLLKELAGGPRLRVNGGIKGSPLEGKGLVSRQFQLVTRRGYVERHGYYFAIFLPGRDWAAPVRDAERVPDGSRAFADGQELFWCAFAWPAVAGATAARAFYVDQNGVIYVSRNEGGAYDGFARMPAPWHVHDRLYGKPKALGAPKAWQGTGREAIQGGPWTRLQ